MRIAIVGAGRIGGNVARRFALAGHEVVLTFSREGARLGALADAIGPRATVADTSDAVARSEVVVLAVPWDVIPAAIDAMGPLDGRIVVDTTNQFGRVETPPTGTTAAAWNASRLPGGRYVKCFNTLTAAFQVDAAERTGDARIVQWICGDDTDAKAVVASLVEGAGYVPVDLGGTHGCAVMEAPRRPGAVYGEEYRAEDAAGVLAAVAQGRAIPPAPAH